MCFNHSGKSLPEPRWIHLQLHFNVERNCKACLHVCCLWYCMIQRLYVPHIIFNFVNDTIERACAFRVNIAENSAILNYLIGTIILALPYFVRKRKIERHRKYPKQQNSALTADHALFMIDLFLRPKSNPLFREPVNLVTNFWFKFL